MVLQYLVIRCRQMHCVCNLCLYNQFCNQCLGCCKEFIDTRSTTPSAFQTRCRKSMWNAPFPHNILVGTGPKRDINLIAKISYKLEQFYVLSKFILTEAFIKILPNYSVIKVTVWTPPFIGWHRFVHISQV